MRPSVFVGCSSESLPVARALQASLAELADVSIWDQGLVAPGTYVLEALAALLQRSDYGVFVLAADDQLLVREQLRAVTRDNVLIELGLFIGHLGRERVALLAPESPPVHLPSDLQGLTVVRYRADRPDRNLRAALGPAATLIAGLLQDLPGLKSRLPPELEMPLLSLRGTLSRNQQSLLAYIEAVEGCSLLDLRRRFDMWTDTELHYRLEQLRFYCFIQSPRREPRAALPVYELHHAFRAELRHARALPAGDSTFPADLDEHGNPLPGAQPDARVPTVLQRRR